MTRVEVVIFAYNHASFIERALRSVLSQRTDTEMSLRIHDDASSDTTVEVIERVMSETTWSWQLVRAPQNRYADGIEFFHQFIASSEADYVAVLDGDDFWIEDDKVESQVAALEAHPSAAIAHHPMLEFADGGFRPIAWPPEYAKVEILPGERLSEQNVISTSSVVLRTSMFPRTMPAGFDALRIGDYPMWAFATEESEIVYLDRPMAAYRIHDTNIWASLDSVARFDRELQARIYIAAHMGGSSAPQWREQLARRVGVHLQVDRLRDENLRIAEERDIQIQMRISAEMALQGVLASTSWRLTAPLRRVVAYMRDRVSRSET